MSPVNYYTLIRRGEIPVFKAGRRSRIPRDKFMKILERRLVFSKQIFKITPRQAARDRPKITGDFHFVISAAPTTLGQVR